MRVRIQDVVRNKKEMKDLCLPITDYGTNVDEFILFIHQVAVGERAWCPLNIKNGKHEKYG